jgi:hypothetical protein
MLMNTMTEALIEEIRTAPESVQREVFDFLVFLKARPQQEANLLPLAQAAWAEDWDNPHEDDVWRDL